jgi:hypothetical protein
LKQGGLPHVIDIGNSDILLISHKLWIAVALPRERFSPLAVTGRPENKNVLVASGCFGMILMGFMSKNPPYNCKFKGARAHINNCK